MLDIPYGNESFDFVIANHVLEHVADDFKAISELTRILKIGGIAILQTPFSNKLKVTLQDAGIDTDLARLQIYCQEDHVRLYGVDIFQRFASAGLQPDIRTHMGLLDDIDATKHGVNLKEPLFLFRKLN